MIKKKKTLRFAACIAVDSTYDLRHKILLSGCGDLEASLTGFEHSEGMPTDLTGCVRIRE